MELSSSGPPERLNNLNKTELSPQRDKDVSHLSKTPEPCDSQEQMVQRCVIVQKDEKGYGLTVSGDNPVFVQSVKEDGAAARAGVQEGDRIIKVNGTLVTQSNHQDVVKLIKSGSYVALTLLGKPPGHARTLSATLQPLNITASNTIPHSIISNKLTSPSERITGPQPVDPEKQQQLTHSRIHTIRKMLEKEVVYLENLRAEFSKTPSEKIHAEVNGCMKRVKTLEEQLVNLTGISHDQIIPKSPKSPSHLRHYHSEKENRHTMVSPTFSHQGRPLMHQVSAPTLPPRPDHFSVPHAKASDACDLSSSTEEPSPGDQTSEIVPTNFRKPSLSLENFQKQLSSRSTTWPQVGPMHTRQSSSPEGLIKHVESMRHPRNPKATESLCRSHSEASQHFHKSPVSELDKHERKNLTSSSSKGSLGQYESTTESPVPSPHGSPPEYAEIADLGDHADGDEHVHEEYQTPPEVAAAEVNIHSVINKLGQNPSIICMEEEDFSSDTELGHLEDHGPFNGLWKLVRNHAHLAIFMHYLMSSKEDIKCSSLFFYLISDLYEQGRANDMKKWAYEIHSSFLVPGAPLKVANVDETILHEIDDVLLHQIDKEEVLRTVFRKARKKAREELNDLLEEFRNKRTMGLANIFSPPDYQLEEAMHDKTKESKIIEQYLLPYLENVTDDFESMSDLHAAKTIALVTMLKQFGCKMQQGNNAWFERCPTFVAKEKSRLWLPQRNKKVMFVQAHQFVPEHYHSVTYCNHCQLIIWGVGNQGYQCQNCLMNIHKMCVKVVEEHCIGSLRNKKERRTEKKERKDRKSGIYRGMENIISKTRKPSQNVPSAIEKAKKMNEEMNLCSDASALNDSGHENSHDSGDRRDLRIDHKINSDSTSLHLNDFNRTHFGGGAKKNAGIGRSESFRQRRESRPSFRKRSDPNIPRSKSDVEVDDKSVSNLNNSGSSSNSSLSNRSLDSSLAEMVHRTPTITSNDSLSPYTSATTNVPSPLASAPSTVHNYDDSDLDAEADPPNWQENLDSDVLQMLKPKDKKRQDVINELFHTEKTHVRNLKVLERIFYRPLLQEQLLPPDFMQLLFPNLEEMIEIHSCFNNKIKARRREESIIGDIGSLLLEMFDGAAGEHLRRAAATFCQNHSIALESLKLRKKKDQKLAQFLADAEVHNLCRRLQLKDIIASGFQRLTKYPLLLENIAKHTATNTQEHSDLLRAVDCSKETLVHVDSAVKEAENLHRLSDIQRRLEKSAFEKVEHSIVSSYKNLDVTKHKLVYEGPLTWRLNKQKSVEMHVVLLEDILMLLQKQDEKYVLKFHNTNLTTKEDNKIMHSPILPVRTLLVRNNATDKRSIFLISSSEINAMYDFVAATASEKKIWCRYLTQAVEFHKAQTGQSIRQQDLPQVVPDFAQSDDAHMEESAGLNNRVSQNNDEASKQNESLNRVEPPSDLSTDEVAESANENDPKDVTSPSSLKSEDSVCKSESELESQKRPHLVEILRMNSEGPQLIEPSEVVISHGAILQTAEPVLTPIEKLRRKDIEIAVAIQEKEKLVGDFLHIPPEEILRVSESEEVSEEKNAHELVLAAVHQGNQLSLILNETLSAAGEESDLEVVDDEEESNVDHRSSTSSFKSVKLPVVSADRLLCVSVSLNKKLTELLAAVTGLEAERHQLRKDLVSAQEQIHFLRDSHQQQYLVRSQSPSNYSACHSRPNSFLSVTSSLSEEALEVTEEQMSIVLKVVTEETPTDVDSCVSNMSFSDAFPLVQSIPQSTMMCNNVIHDVTPSEHAVVVNTSCRDVSVQPVTDLDCDLTPQEAVATSTNGNTEHFDGSSLTMDSMCEMQVGETSVNSIYF